ncbi:hypothetical protein RvY_19044, partial [Ramazzottius varieornatus]
LRLRTVLTAEATVGLLCDSDARSFSFPSRSLKKFCSWKKTSLGVDRTCSFTLSLQAVVPIKVQNFRFWFD